MASPRTQEENKANTLYLQEEYKRALSIPETEDKLAILRAQLKEAGILTD